MKKFLLFTFLAAVGASAGAQNLLQMNPNFEPSVLQSVSPVPMAADDMEVTWLTSQTESNNYGNTGSGVYYACMELTVSDILNYKNQGKALSEIRQIQFFLNLTGASTVSACRIIVRQGTSLASSTITGQQTVATSALVAGGWTSITFDTPVPVDQQKSLYIGYEATFKAGYPFSVATCTNYKQAYLMISSTSILNLVNDNYGSYGFMIKAIAGTTEGPALEVMMESISLPASALQNENIALSGVIRNLGTSTVTSLTITTDINGDVSSHPFSGINLPANGTYTFTIPGGFTLTEPKEYIIKYTVSNPNGSADFTDANNSLSGRILGMSENVQRMCLLESFTSSTCGPCYAGNANLKNVLAQADENKWANIRYQMNWPGNGDPYYTDEGGVRRTLYGVTGVPDLLIDGPTTELNPASFQLSLLNSLAAKPAYAKIFAYASVVGQTVDATFTVTPVITIPVSNRKFFAAVVEKQTVKNVGGNGEKEFLYVMKKFLTSTSGNSLNNFVAGTPQSFDLSYTFNGNYRLPANGLTANIINHAIEHSVEDFGDLMVVCWIQDMSTGEVLQAFKTDAYLNVPPVMITSAEQAIHQTNDSKVLVQLKNKNTTNAAVTSYKVEYKVGNNATQTFLRDGINLPALADDLLDLPLLEIPLAEKTNLTATITEYNGVVIDDPSIVSIELFKDLAQSDKMDMLLKLWQDRYGQATTWKLFDLENKEVAKGGPYTELTSDVIRLRETQLLVPANGVYRFEIYDSQGDGINNGHGNGHYQISASDVDNPILTGDGKFGAKAVHYINVDDKGGAIASKIAATAPYVYASTLYLPQQTAGTLSIYNAQGKAVILNRNLGSGAISLGSLPSGVYIIKVDSATGSSILKAIL